MKTTEGKVVWCEGDEEAGRGLREGRATVERPQWRSRSSSRHRIIEPATALPIIYRTIESQTNRACQGNRCSGFK
ncbi:unnamed protein product [Clonostachys solani]|uniref:Uncharacterized protein n=1 Tax=Clonostachys solani TaxID=160281 RepID=A0A9N9ZNC4_9HYPO|nr:unnamed protein product [Clonostachys solani]